MQRQRATAFSGGVAETADLGLPEPARRPLDGVAVVADVPHRFALGQVWADGAAKQRVALLGELSEADVVHNGTDLWTYTSRRPTPSPTPGSVTAAPITPAARPAGGRPAGPTPRT